MYHRRFVSKFQKKKERAVENFRERVRLLEYTVQHARMCLLRNSVSHFFVRFHFTFKKKLRNLISKMKFLTSRSSRFVTKYYFATNYGSTNIWYKYDFSESVNYFHTLFKRIKIISLLRTRTGKKVQLPLFLFCDANDSKQRSKLMNLNFHYHFM